MITSKEAKKISSLVDIVYRELNRIESEIKRYAQCGNEYIIYRFFAGLSKNIILKTINRLKELGYKIEKVLDSPYEEYKISW